MGHIHISTLHEWDGQTIDHLFRHIWQAPKKLVHELRMEKAININGKPAKWNDPLQTGDAIEIYLHEEMNTTVVPVFHSLKVLYEDDYLLVVNKPAGMATHPNDAKDEDTLANAVAYYLEANGDKRKVRHVHRLDQDTTGAVLFAKHALIHAILDKMLVDHRVSRTYWALAEGIIQKDELLLHYPIGRDRHHPTRRRVSPSGQKAVTHMKVLKRLRQNNLTLIECNLETGRTHQIRVHMSHIGHPLAGDTLYGGRQLFQRQALHARNLSFLHPFTLEKVECTAPFIDDVFLPFLKN